MCKAKGFGDPGPSTIWTALIFGPGIKLALPLVRGKPGGWPCPMGMFHVVIGDEVRVNVDQGGSNTRVRHD